jgi:hypothetical protein
LSLLSLLALGDPLRFSASYRTVGDHTEVAALCSAVGDREAFSTQSAPP